MKRYTISRAEIQIPVMDIAYLQEELYMSSWAHSLQVVCNLDYFAGECAKTLHKLYL